MGEGITCPLRRRSSRESVVLRATVAETRIFALVSYEGKVGKDYAVRWVNPRGSVRRKKVRANLITRDRIEWNINR